MFAPLFIAVVARPVVIARPVLYLHDRAGPGGRSRVGLWRGKRRRGKDKAARGENCGGEDTYRGHPFHSFSVCSLTPNRSGLLVNFNAIISVSRREFFCLDPEHAVKRSAGREDAPVIIDSRG
jgi:hypothetical protein